MGIPVESAFWVAEKKKAIAIFPLEDPAFETKRSTSHYQYQQNQNRRKSNGNLIHSKVFPAVAFDRIAES